MSKREVRALQAEQSEAREGLRTLSGRNRKRRHGETETDMSDEESLKDKIADLERRLTEATREIGEKEKELATTREDLRLARTEIDAEKANLEAARKEAELLHRKTKEVERERDELRTRVESEPVGHSEMMRSFDKFIQAQTKMMQAQANAVAVQSFPPLPMFTGEDIDSDEKRFDKWLERFEERASLADWTDEQRFHQFKFHLSQSALHVFRLLSESERGTYASAVKALKKRFKPIDIEELRSLEFHQKMQDQESVEKLGLDLQRLARKAYPGMGETEFDRMLKGRFYQALLTKWQRKLGAPKLDESFTELYDRACMLEMHDQQYTAAAQARDGKAKGATHTEKVRKLAEQPKPSSQTQSSEKPSGEGLSPSVLKNSSFQQRSKYSCWKCGEVGNLARHCKKKTNEAVGSSSKSTPSKQNSRTATIEVSDPIQSLTDAQLESILAERRRSREQSLLSESSQVNAVTACGEVAAISPTLVLDITIEGEPVQAMVDSGSQSTIISRETLHRIGRRLSKQGQPLPLLEAVSGIKLWGKDGKYQLDITAKVTLTMEAGGKAVKVPVFIQPDSQQPCLLGMNAAPALGIAFLDAQGVALRQLLPLSSPHAKVSLIQASVVPGQKGLFLEGQIEGPVREGHDVLFEPDWEGLSKQGLGTFDSLLTVGSEGRVFIPVQNTQPVIVKLETGVPLGVVEPCESEPSTACSDVPAVSAVIQAEHSGERKEQLKNLLNLPETGLSALELDQLQQTVLEAEDVFALTDSELGCTGIVKHNIDTEGHSPIKQQVRRTPFIQREKIAQMVAEMEVRGVIQPSVSPWASPIVLVPKKDGSTRFCVDYRRLNAITRKDVYPLPRIDDILDTLGQSKYFSTLDLSAGYWQIELDPKSKEKSAFTTHCGLFEFNRMPFGLCNAPATFQRLMQSVLAGLEGRICFVYIDDILVCSRTFEEHLSHLKQVFDRLRQAHLKLKPKKCVFLKPRVHYLGHVISRDGISPDPAKTDKIRRYPEPTDETKLRQFLGLASYYRRFIPGFARVASPLHTLTKKGVQFQWTWECQLAFDQLKELLCTAPVLAYPQFGGDRHFILETDASLAGLGAVLAQVGDDGQVHPIAYASRSLLKHERNYAITELETLALVWAVKHFRAYLLGHRCVVYTDHAACTSLLNTPHPSAKLARWAMIVQEMDLEIKHRAGKGNTNADALSRNPVDDARVAQLEASDSICSLPEDGEIAAKQGADPDFQVMIAYIKDGSLPANDKQARRVVLERPHFDLVDGILCHENPHFPGRWCTAVPKEMREFLMREAHSGKFSGHFAEKRIYDLLRRSYWWPGMRTDVRTYCRSCLVCATKRGTGRVCRPPLQNIPVSGPFHRVGVDVVQLPLTQAGNKYAVVFIDYLTKWVEVFAVADQTAETVARLFVEGVVCRHGVPQELLSDRGGNFLSALMQEVCRLMGVKKLNTSGYHPQCNGLVERFNSTLIQMLAKVTKNPKDWDQCLPYVVYAYHTAAQESTKESPFFLMYGRDPQIPTVEALSTPSTPYTVDLDDYQSELITGLSDAWEAAAEHIKVAQCHQKRMYDRGASELKLKIGDRVLVHMPHEVRGNAWKFARPFHGPYRVVSLTPTNAEVRLVDQPNDDSIFVSLNRVRRCYDELPNVSWSGKQSSKRRRSKAKQTDSKPTGTSPPQAEYSGPMTRSRTHATNKD